MGQKTTHIFGREPVLYITLLRTGLALAVGFGLNSRGEQVALVVAFADAVFGFITRQAVTPSQTARMRINDAYRAGMKRAPMTKAEHLIQSENSHTTIQKHESTS